MSAARTIDFGGVDIAFNEGVLEPRAWTVMQAEWARELASSLRAGAFVGLGCGADPPYAATGVTPRYPDDPPDAIDGPSIVDVRVHDEHRVALLRPIA